MKKAVIAAAALVAMSSADFADSPGVGATSRAVNTFDGANACSAWPTNGAIATSKQALLALLQLRSPQCLPCSQRPDLVMALATPDRSPAPALVAAIARNGASSWCGSSITTRCVLPRYASPLRQL
jgi:hypothetical protein